ALQLRAPGRRDPAEAGRRQDDRRGRQGTAGVQGEPVRGAAEGGLSGDPVRRAGWRSVRGRGRAGIAREDARRRPGRPLHRRGRRGGRGAGRGSGAAKGAPAGGGAGGGGGGWAPPPPFLSVFRDEDGDGTSDRQDVLVSGLTTSLIDERGGDHTTNGIRMGLDGWIYIAVGDYGFHGAKGKDGTTLSQRGGGILRVRPDGTELEVFAIGLRNPFAIAIDPYLNLFTRDNTNDGAGWDVRVSHLIQTADYGYSQRFANFPDEIMPPLGAYGQGGGTGALSVHDERWPDAYRGVLLTGDWGRSEVYRHILKPA